ncbi:Uma2 family endonuclease [Embleya sp. NBC_00896]|uniref:Uma2 family endonuclease n=1 Tax=Embleya sp. NBC_00896 TaxID=2975961 RepID=UPI00386F3C9C|nr:Uma2 family endonuclease [Embleya sp. NBC_00896]
MGREEFDRLTAIADSVRAPSNYKIEISDGTLVMMTGRSGIHEFIVRRLRMRIEHGIAGRAEWAGMAVHGGMDVLDEVNLMRRNPDVCVFPEDDLLTVENHIPAADVKLAVEVVSRSNPENDWEAKLRDYPRMHIPVYLIVDPRQGTIAVNSEPKAGKYTARAAYVFGQEVPLPYFGFAVATADFPTY